MSIAKSTAQSSSRGHGARSQAVREVFQEILTGSISVSEGDGNRKNVRLSSHIAERVVIDMLWQQACQSEPGGVVSRPLLYK